MKEGETIPRVQQGRATTTAANQPYRKQVRACEDQAIKDKQQERKCWSREPD